MCKDTLRIITQYFEQEQSIREIAQVMTEVVDDYATYVCCSDTLVPPANCRETLIDLQILRNLFKSLSNANHTK